MSTSTKAGYRRKHAGGECRPPSKVRWTCCHQHLQRRLSALVRVAENSKTVVRDNTSEWGSAALGLSSWCDLSRTTHDTRARVDSHLTRSNRIAFPIRRSGNHRRSGYGG